MIVPHSALGVGIGYRRELDKAFTSHVDAIDFFEFIGDTCFDEDVLARVTTLSRSMPSVCHTLGLSLGTREPLDRAYLRRLARVIASVSPRWVSDHLAITSVGGMQLGHLTPVLFCHDTVAYMSEKVDEVQQYLGTKLLLENITCSVVLPGAELSEPEVLSLLAAKSGCGILLDLNNLYINSHNLDFDPYDYLRSFPLAYVDQVHIGGAKHENDGSLSDSHGHPVASEVFDYLAFVADRRPAIATLLERDQNFEPIDDVLADMHTAREILARATTLPIRSTSSGEVR